MHAPGKLNSDTVRNGGDNGCMVGCMGSIVTAGTACETPGINTPDIIGSLKNISCPKLAATLQVGVQHGDGSIKSGTAAFGVLVRSNIGQGGTWALIAAISNSEFDDSPRLNIGVPKENSLTVLTPLLKCCIRGAGGTLIVTPGIDTPMFSLLVVKFCCVTEPG